jgi:signal transduction histidine kinase
VISLESSRPNAFGVSEFESAVRLSDHAAIAIANARLYGEVKRANDAKSEFVSIVSHELKTPMTSIKGYTDLLIKGAGGPLNELQQQFLNTVRANVERMSTLVGDLLEISRIETGRLKLDLKPVSMSSVIEDTLRTTQRQIEEKQQALDVSVSDNLPQVMGDRARLIQVMTNLISNAYKYTPAGGHIAISVQPKANGSPGFVMCAIKDSGIGISEEDQAKLFTKFFRSGDPAVREVPGTGLGLSITKSLIELQGGQIWVESQLGKGTTFAFTVPVADKAG